MKQYRGILAAFVVGLLIDRWYVMGKYYLVPAIDGQTVTRHPDGSASFHVPAWDWANRPDQQAVNCSVMIVPDYVADGLRDGDYFNLRGDRIKKGGGDEKDRAAGGP